MEPKPSKPSRSPNGVGKVVALRLLPDEQAELETIAANEVRSAASMARLIYLNGIERYRRHSSPTSVQ